MTDDSQPTEPELTSFHDVGRIQLAMIQVGMVDAAIAEGAFGRLFSRERESEEILNDRLSTHQWRNTE